MRIAIEAHALSQDKITGVGNVVLHYVNELQKSDASNEYFIYAMDDLRHVTFANPLWHDMNFSYALKSFRLHVTAKWRALNSTVKGRGVLFLHILLLRILKIALELSDEFVFSLKLSRSLKNNRVDIYIGTSTYYYPYFFLSPVKKVGILYDLVWKLFPHTMEFGNKIRMSLFTLRTMRKLDLLVSISENTMNDARAILAIDTRIDAIPLAADKNIFRQAKIHEIAAIKKKYGINKKYILTVCTLEPRKNLKTLLSAFRSMPDRRNYQLVLVGMAGWNTSDLFKDIRSSDISANVLFTGYVPNNELAPLYTGAELFVFPTLYEGFGLPVLEAMQCGCPVITSNTSSIPEVAGDAAVMLDPEDVNGLSSAMEKLLKNAAARKDLSKKGLLRSKHFSWERSAKILLESLKSLL